MRVVVLDETTNVDVDGREGVKEVVTTETTGTDDKDGSFTGVLDTGCAGVLEKEGTLLEGMDVVAAVVRSV